MNDLDTILRPFAGAEAGPWRRRLWTLLLLGAPLMGALGFWLHGQLAHGPGFRVQIDRKAALKTAHELAKANGLETRGWREHVKFEEKPVTVRYLKTHELGREMRARRFLPDATVTVFLMRPDGGAWVRAEMGMRGFVTEYRIGDRKPPPATGEVAEEEVQRAAERALQEWLGDMAVQALGEPEVTTTEEAGAAGARRFTWRVAPKQAEEVELVARVDVLGKKVIGREMEPVFSAGFMEREVNLPASKAEMWLTLRLVLILGLVLYGFYRYARRTMEKEAPHGRVLLLMAMFLAVSALFTAGNPDATADRMDAGNLRTQFVVARLVLSVMFAAIFGGVLGVAYGAGEGEVRERWPGKLTSLDAVLTGRVWSANVGVSVVAGLAWAAWLFGLAAVGQALMGERLGNEALETVAFTFGSVPLLLLLANAPMSAVTLTVLNLLGPLTYLRRHVKRGWLIVVVLAGVGMLVAGMAQRIEPDSAMFWLGAAALTAAVLGPFYAQDYLASVVAVAGLNLFGKVSDLSATAPYWQERLDLVALAVAAVAAPLAVAAWKGRRYEEKDVRPKHARNLAERLGMQAELSAAREAQVRLLPERPPEVAGLEIAASCTPAQAVSGDFYDFFPLSGGRLGMVVAEGGNEGLASALTIALAKGFLMYEAAEGTAIEEAVEQLEAALGAHLNRGSARTSLGLFLMDPGTGVLQMARTGRYPGMLVVGRDGGVKEPAVWQQDERQELEVARLEMAVGEAVVIYTDGLPRLMQERAAGSVAELLKQAAWFGQGWTAETLHGALMEAAKGKAEGQALSDDLTAVVVRYDGTAASREEAA